MVTFVTIVTTVTVVTIVAIVVIVVLNYSKMHGSGVASSQRQETSSQNLTPQSHRTPCSRQAADYRGCRLLRPFSWADSI